LKKIYTVVFLLLNLTSFSQSDKNAGEIIRLVVNDYKADTIEVFYKFNNQSLIRDLWDEESRKLDFGRIFNDCSKKFDTITESKKIAECIANGIPNDSATFEFEKIRIPFFGGDGDILKKMDNKKIAGFFKGKYQKNRKFRPMAAISFPLFDKHKKKAIVYCSYLGVGLSGNMGYFILEKINDKWEISHYIIRGFI
jgi:hypothetical protein